MVLTPKKAIIVPTEYSKVKRYSKKYTYKSFYNDIIHIIDSAELRNLPDSSYSVSGWDFSSITLKIYYNDGSQKNYYEYGLQNKDVAKLLYKKLDKEHSHIQTHIKPPKKKSSSAPTIPEGVWIKLEERTGTNTYISVRKGHKYFIEMDFTSNCVSSEFFSISEKKDSVILIKSGYLGEIKIKKSHFSIINNQIKQEFVKLPTPNFKADSIKNYTLLLGSWNEIECRNYKNLVQKKDTPLNITFINADTLMFKPFPMSHKYNLQNSLYINKEIFHSESGKIYVKGKVLAKMVYLDEELLIFQNLKRELHFFIKE
jgi:hypothetical protein